MLLPWTSQNSTDKLVPFAILPAILICREGCLGSLPPTKVASRELELSRIFAGSRKWPPGRNTSRWISRWSEHYPYIDIIIVKSAIPRVAWYPPNGLEFLLFRSWPFRLILFHTQHTHILWLFLDRCSWIALIPMWECLSLYMMVIHVAFCTSQSKTAISEKSPSICDRYGYFSSKFLNWNCLEFIDTKSDLNKLNSFWP